MSAGEVVFKASEDYDADMWDDSILIRNYERAEAASRRELMRRRKEGARRQKHWTLGDPCRVLSTTDGLEYEGTVVRTTARVATVRLHGYNEELEVPLGDLTASLGQEEIQNQIAQAQAFQECEEEEDFVGELKVGDFCRARWSLDDVVYEGVVESLNTKKRRAKIKFLGYENEETVDLDQVFATKGPEWQDQQVQESQFNLDNDDISEDIERFIDEDVEALSQTLDLPMLERLSLTEGKSKEKREKLKKTETPKVKSDKVKYKNDKDKTKCDKKKLKTGLCSDPSQSIPPSSLPGASVMFSDVNELPLFGLPSLLPSDLLHRPIPDLPTLPPVQNQGGFPSMLVPPPPPQPIVNPTDDAQAQMLHSMLISWYMAGYHTGFYQAANQPHQHNKKK